MHNNRDQNMIIYQQRLNMLLERRREAEKLLDDAIKNYNNISTGFSLRKDIKLRGAENIVHLREKNLNVINTELEYLRPRNKEDMEYRDRQYKDFSEYIMKKIPDDLPLRFHGSPIRASKGIILSGEISSYGDRFGVEMSYDTPGQIYVNTKDNIFNTVRNFCNLTYDYDLPAGCLFVITPKDKKDELTGHNQTMESVYFKNNPDRLVAIVSTPENVNRLKGWMIDNDLSPDKVFDYDGFSSSIEKIVDTVVIQYKENNRENKTFSSLESLITTANKRVSNNKHSIKSEKDIAFNIEIDK